MAAARAGDAKALPTPCRRWCPAPAAPTTRWSRQWLDLALAHEQRRQGIPPAAEPVVREMTPGSAHLWGYNGQSPGPTIEVVEGDRVRLFVTNKLAS